MNSNIALGITQVESAKGDVKTRAEYRREKANIRKKEQRASKSAGYQASKTVKALREGTMSYEDMAEAIETVKKNLVAHTWRDLEANGTFDHDKKLTFIKEDMLIIGCDIGSETHYFRAVDSKGIELGKKAVSFPNSEEGFKGFKDWAVDLSVKNGKTQIVLGLEPTGHYWFTIAHWMIKNGITVVQVNPYAVKCTKEVADNSQNKDDQKDPKVIAELVKNGNYGMPYLPEGVHAELRGLSRYRDQLMEDRTRAVNRLHREIKIHFPEYKDTFGDIDGVFSLKLLREAPMPDDILALGEEGVKGIWKAAGLKGRGYQKAKTVVDAARHSIGIKDSIVAGRMAAKRFAGQILELSEEITKVEALIQEKCEEIPNATNILEIRGIGNDILGGVLAELGDISRFDSTKEIQKLSGLGLVANSSGKHEGQTKISKRGRKRLRYWLYQGAMSVVSHADEFREIHTYYTTRAENPLKKMQSLIAIACKLLRIIYVMLKTGVNYNPTKLLSDIKRPDGSKMKIA